MCRAQRVMPFTLIHRVFLGDPFQSLRDKATRWSPLCRRFLSASLLASVCGAHASLFHEQWPQWVM